ncbi:MAG: serine hydrolase, partial [Arenimonas sp.]|nr:serine hydrolase [Arenimonas sp.]
MQRRIFLQTSLCLPALALPRWAVAADDFWPRVFSAMPAQWAAVASNPEYRVQILCQYRKKNSRAHWHKTSWQLTPKRWFSTASVAKLPIALLACEKIASLNLDLTAKIGFTQPPIGGEWPADEPYFESLQRTLTRIFTISENPPFNRLYDFLGGDAMNERLETLDYPTARLISRMSAPVLDNNRTRAGMVLNAQDGPVYEFAEREGKQRVFAYGEAMIGKGFLKDSGELINGPHDFSKTNYISLTDSQQMLKAIVDPASVPVQQRWAIPDTMREQVLKIMALMPRQSTDPIYPEAEYPDGYGRFFILGDVKTRKPDSLTLIGKVGEAYGYLTDVEYITDTQSDWECYLSANIYVNADGIFNDDKYEYDSIGYPFLAALGRAV